MEDKKFTLDTHSQGEAATREGETQAHRHDQLRQLQYY